MTVPESVVQTAMQAARKTREFWAGSHFDVPHDAVEQYTEGVVRAALAAVLPTQEEPTAPEADRG